MIHTPLLHLLSQLVSHISGVLLDKLSLVWRDEMCCPQLGVAARRLLCVTGRPDLSCMVCRRVAQAEVTCCCDVTGVLCKTAGKGGGGIR